MEGHVLYRKWRPPSFSDVVGQGPITQALENAVASNRISHAYLLCGPRGTGKTSTARVLAKALNCLEMTGGESNPCGSCRNCVAIDQGSFIDLIEIDAASNRRLDEMRDLLEKVRFAPTQGRNKVYIIDEAHALTSDAFNAFLKTLEEPPPSTIFILATTDPHLLPPTIVSRCQRYDFHRIQPKAITQRLDQISADEGASISPEVLQSVARASAGSLRDAINLLDQLITSFGSDISIEQLHALLGIVSEDRAIELVKHLLLGETPMALAVINSAATAGVDLRPLHRVTVDLLRATLLTKVGVADSLDMSPEAEGAVASLAAQTSLERVFRALRIFGQVSLKYDQPSPLPLELAAVELGLHQAASMPDAIPTPTDPNPVRPLSSNDGVARANNAALKSEAEPQASPRKEAPQAAERLDDSEPVSARISREEGPILQQGDRLHTEWPAILKAMSRLPRKRFDIAALLRSSSQRRVEGTQVIISFNHRSHSERLLEELENPQCRLGIQAILSEMLGGEYTLEVESNASTSNRTGGQSTSHLVRAALSFGGKVVPAGNAHQESDQVPSPAIPTPQAGGGIITTDESIEGENEQESR